MFMAQSRMDELCIVSYISHTQCTSNSVNYFNFVKNISFLRLGDSNSKSKAILYQVFIVYRMKIDKSIWSCSWNNDQNCTQNSFRATFCLSKLGLVKVFPVRSFSNLQKYFNYFFACLHLWFFGVNIVYFPGF